LDNSPQTNTRGTAQSDGKPPGITKTARRLVGMPAGSCAFLSGMGMPLFIALPNKKSSVLVYPIRNSFFCTNNNSITISPKTTPYVDE